MSALLLEQAPRLYILDADPTLAAVLDGAELEEARRSIFAEVVHLRRGIHAPGEILGSRDLVAVLLLDGLIVRQLVVGDRRCGELIGTGSVLRAGDDFGETAPLPFTVRWRVLRGARLALLDRRGLALMARWPPLVEMLVQRTMERVEALGLVLAIHSMKHVRLRLLMLAWHFADRFGKVTPGGIHVPLPLSHADFAELVGAARPSVSLALRELAEARQLWRTAERTWMLDHQPPEMIRQ